MKASTRSATRRSSAGLSKSALVIGRAISMSFAGALAGKVKSDGPACPRTRRCEMGAGASRGSCGKGVALSAGGRWFMRVPARELVPSSTASAAGIFPALVALLPSLLLTMTKAPSAPQVARSKRVVHSDLGAVLEQVIANTDMTARLQVDPVGIVHAFKNPADQELVGLLASSLAFGNVKTVTAKIRDVLARLREPPSRICDRPERVHAALAGWVHRVYRGEDVARLLIGARAVQRASGSLGGYFAAELRRHGSLRPALSAFVHAIRQAGGFAEAGRAASHLLPDPAGQSGCKRLLLYLRWMVRPADGIDLGLWSSAVPASILLIPVDTHIHKIARNLGLTARAAVSWDAAEEITAHLARLCPEDPVRYDFPLCHMGMLQRCPSRRDAVRCEGCGVMPLCVHWRGRRARAKIV